MLRDALDAVSLALRHDDEVIVVDSGSRTDHTRKTAEHAGALVLRSDRPGACRARNMGWRAATTDIVAFTDDDCLPTVGWVKAVSAAFVESPEASFLTGRVVADDVIRGHAELNLSLFVSDRPARFHLGDDLREMGHGANMAWRRSALAAIGGFDEGMGPGTEFRAAEDQDAFWRSLREGGTGRFDPQAVVVHRHWRNRRNQLGTVFSYGIGSGALAVKRWRVEASLAGRPTRSLLWGINREAAGMFIGRAFEHLRRHYEMGMLGELWFLAGFVWGSIRARHVPLSGDRWQL